MYLAALLSVLVFRFHTSGIEVEVPDITLFAVKNIVVTFRPSVRPYLYLLPLDMHVTFKKMQLPQNEEEAAWALSPTEGL